MMTTPMATSVSGSVSAANRRPGGLEQVSVNQRVLVRRRVTRCDEHHRSVLHHAKFPFARPTPDRLLRQLDRCPPLSSLPVRPARRPARSTRPPSPARYPSSSPFPSELNSSSRMSPIPRRFPASRLVASPRPVLVERLAEVTGSPRDQGHTAAARGRRVIDCPSPFLARRLSSSVASSMPPRGDDVARDK